MTDMKGRPKNRNGRLAIQARYLDANVPASAAPRNVLFWKTAIVSKHGDQSPPCPMLQARGIRMRGGAGQPTVFFFFFFKSGVEFMRWHAGRGRRKDALVVGVVRVRCNVCNQVSASSVRSSLLDIRRDPEKKLGPRCGWSTGRPKYGSGEGNARLLHAVPAKQACAKRFLRVARMGQLPCQHVTARGGPIACSSGSTRRARTRTRTRTHLLRGLPTTCPSSTTAASPVHLIALLPIASHRMHLVLRRRP